MYKNQTSIEMFTMLLIRGYIFMLSNMIYDILKDKLTCS